LVDYGVAPRQLYTDLVIRQIRKYDNLDFFGSCETLNSSKLGFSSWVPDWTVKDPVVFSRLPKSVREGTVTSAPLYQACGAATNKLNIAQPTLPEPRQIVLAGVKITNVAEILEPVFRTRNGFEDECGWQPVDGSAMCPLTQVTISGPNRPYNPGLGS
jgi:hypothetical protein